MFRHYQLNLKRFVTRISAISKIVTRFEVLFKIMTTIEILLTKVSLY